MLRFILICLFIHYFTFYFIFFIVIFIIFIFFVIFAFFFTCYFKEVQVVPHHLRVHLKNSKEFAEEDQSNSFHFYCLLSIYRELFERCNCEVFFGRCKEDQREDVFMIRKNNFIFILIIIVLFFK